MKEGQPKAIELSDYKVTTHIIENTELDIDIHDGQTLVKSRLTIQKNPESKEPGNALVLNGGADLETKELAIDGRVLLSNEYSIEGETLTLFDVPESFELTSEVLIVPEKNTALEGLYQSGDMYCTQCEAEGFRNITWYLDRPDALSTFTTTVRANREQYPILLANGNNTDSGVEGDRHWATWHDPFKKPAYLFAMVAGNLQHIEDTFVTMSGREVKLQIFTEAHNIDKVDYAMTSLKNSMRWDEETYGREYDLDIFMIVAVESFNMGAMENKGLNIFNTSCVLARPDTTTDAGYQRVEAVVGHEYFHNWSGNRVTCRDWFQLSLKEGFTVLRDQQFSAAMGSETVCRVNDVSVLRNSQFPEDAGPMAHPIRPSSYIEINNFYTATVYEKGAEVVRMIRTLLGADKFRKGTDLYFDRHDGQAVTTEDFVRAMEDANDADLSQFRYWYSQAGTPVLSINDHYDREQQTYTLEITQSCPATPGQPEKQPFHMPITLGLLDGSGKDMVLVCDDLDVANIVHEGQNFSVVLNLREATQSFTFKNISEKPVPSLLRGFSAPVKVNVNYSREQLVFLMTHDSDGFNRWEASQKLAISVIKEAMAQIEAGDAAIVDDLFVKAYEQLLDQAIACNDDSDYDKAMVAQMLVLPSEAYLAELVDVVDVDVIHSARDAVRQTLATKLKGLFLSVYKLNSSSAPFEATGTQVAERALKNVSLAYLMTPADTDMVKLCVEQYEQANNMTDAGAAIRALISCPGDQVKEAAETALTHFYEKWQHEALVIDQWFSMQAMVSLPETLDKVEALLQHSAFTLKTPNRARALIGGFAGNVSQFHRADGAGYKFLADRVIELNALNPQLAARLLTPLTRWGKHIESRQALMKAELARILETENLSRDVFEIASKSL